jgi:hypothetical protein
MTAEEIRGFPLTAEDADARALESVLREIAAQLAELNETLKPGKFAVNRYDAQISIAWPDQTKLSIVLEKEKRLQARRKP